MSIASPHRSALNTFVTVTLGPTSGIPVLVMVMTPAVSSTVTLYGSLSTAAGGGQSQSTWGAVHRVDPKFVSWAALVVKRFEPLARRNSTTLPPAACTAKYVSPNSST